MKTLLTNARLATLAEDRPGLGIVEDAAVLIEDGRIAFAGPAAELGAERSAGAKVQDLEGRWVTPALVDCHTHLVHGGDRAREFEMRLAGASYEEIARAGGGIVSSIAATRALSVEDLARTALPRLDALLAEGTSTVEVKSGYGLDIETEIAMLTAARRLAELRPVRIATTWLAAHATPPDYKGRNVAYLDEVAIPGLKRAAELGLVDAVDGFCEGIAFSAEEITPVFEAAKALGLPVKLHAEQLSHAGGAALTARFGGLSADHLEYATADDARAMAKAGTVAVLLPGAYYFIRETKLPPVDAFRAAGTRIALATDCNPGTSPLTSLLLTMNMGATLFRLTVEECLAGVTREGARALGLLAETGTIEAGKSADLAVWDIASPAELVYRIGFNPLSARYFKGEEIRR
ncbi:MULTISPECIES: imidazolonepropionase [unclassified Aureimonas]|uniref:imidazolonepropionase n=1 Tax=unclassified Aureimonas TaxID=2615206 RepID=UPI00070220F7|nr:MULTISPECIES: imidazolonepropionase [unclassified Aureimonas]KQT69890.1 imidazolonepropionase [Aureimonas sp. Leaf427]KQT75956.1 imidazolonepropionase [Aureimonas sp. Leaf460]